MVYEILHIGLGVYTNVDLGIFHIDSDGNIVIRSLSIEWGTVAAATGTVSGYYMRTDAKRVIDLEGWVTNVGVSGYEAVGLG